MNLICNFLLSGLVTISGIHLFKADITGLFETVFSLFGRSFSGRSPLIQNLFLAGAGLIFTIALALLLGKTAGMSEKLYNILTIAGFALILFVIASICFTQTIRRDDYWEIHDSRAYGFPGFLEYEFFNINGRYFNLLLKSVYALLPFRSITLYINTLLFLNFVCLWAAGTRLVRNLLQSFTDQISRHLTAGMGMCLALGAVFVSPKPWEVWFWGGGTFIYGVGITLAVLTMALYLEALGGKPRWALTFIAVTCACGCSELTTASVCIIGAGLILIDRLWGSRHWNRPLIIFTLWSWLCTAFALFFSGSGDFAGQLVTENASSGAGRVMDSLRTAAETLAAHLYGQIEPILFFAILFFILGMSFRFVKGYIKPAAALALLLVLTAFPVLAINTYMGYTPARVVTIPLFWILIAICGVCFLLGGTLRRRVKLTAVRLTPLLTVLLLCLLSGAFYKDNMPELRNIRSAWKYRDQQLSAIADKSRPVESCTIPIMGSRSYDLTEDPNFEINIVTAVYYGFPGITASRPCLPPDPQ